MRHTLLIPFAVTIMMALVIDPDVHAASCEDLSLTNDRALVSDFLELVRFGRSSKRLDLARANVEKILGLDQATALWGKDREHSPFLVTTTARRHFVLLRAPLDRRDHIHLFVTRDIGFTTDEYLSRIDSDIDQLRSPTLPAGDPRGLTLAEELNSSERSFDRVIQQFGKDTGISMAVDGAFGEARQGVRQAGGRAILFRYVRFISVRESDGGTSAEITAFGLARLISMLEQMK